MANYTPTFTKPYPNGWVDKPSKTTPATAAIMNSYDTAIAALEAYLRDNAIDTVSVSVEQFPSDGRQWLGTITVGRSNQYKIYMPSLKYENSVSNGTKIGTITLGEQSFDVYVPTSSAGGSTVSVVPKTLTGTNIAEITVDGTTYQLYAPTGSSGGGSTVTAEATLTEGTEIGKITIDGTETILYAPTASAITVDSELSSTSENPVQNKVVKAEFDEVNSDLSDLKVSDVAGGKNLFKNYDTYNSYEVIAETYNGNSVIYSANNWYGAYQSNLVLKKGKTYAISAYVKGSGNYYILCNRVNGDNVNIHGAEKLNDEWIKITTVYTPPFDVNKVRIENNTTGGLYISCFQIEESTQATDYEPYIPSVKMLVEENAQQNDSLSVLGKCKNLLNPTLQTTTQNGVTCTNNGNGTYTLNGTTTAKVVFALQWNITLDIGTYVINSINPIRFSIEEIYSPYKTYGSTFTKKIFTMSSKVQNLKACIIIDSGITISNLVFNPMLTTNLNATYDDFVPYTGDGDTLTADVASIKKKVDEGGTGGSITVDSTLSTESENPVQNKIVTTELNKKLETLDDESQEPDAVNFDLDSELSLTSTKGVQNKVITAALNGILKITDLSNKLKNGRYNDYSLNYDFSKCYKINNIIYGQLFIVGLNDDEKPNKRILVAAFDEDYFQGRTSDASFFCGYLEMLEGNGNIYSSDKNNRIQIPLVYDPINYEIEAISLEDDTLHFQSTAILSGYFRLIT